MIYVILFPFLVLNVFSLETDNYLSWELNLKDSSDKINWYFEQEIRKALKISNSKSKSQSCSEVTSEISSRFKAFLVHNNPVENWLIQNLDNSEVYPSTFEYVEQSIYRNPWRFYIPKFGLAPNIQVNGIYFGMDKLTHLTSTGRIYFSIYKHQMDKGHSETDSEISAITYGLLDELSIHGLGASGVYSYADLEANYQGLRFYKRFCSQAKDNYLMKGPDQKWSLKKPPQIEDYVNPGWDETYNSSFYLKGNWKKIEPVISSYYCSRSKEQSVSKRFKSYEGRWEKNLSQHFIESLKALNSPLTPKDKSQNLSIVCQ